MMFLWKMKDMLKEIMPWKEMRNNMNKMRIEKSTKKLKVIHRNLGHPNKETMIRMLRDAGADERTLRVAQNFECATCLQRGRRAPARPAAVMKKYNKWECVSMDTFWWHTPKEALNAGCKPVYTIGLSLMDEATDYHVAVIIKTSKDGPLRNISADDFRRAFSTGWLRNFPAPSLLRYDEEGFMRSLGYCPVVGSFWNEA